MKIKNIKVNNFKSFKELEWKLNKGLNLIYGYNASGKSTIIEIFNFLDKIVTKETNLIKASNNVLPITISVYDEFISKGFENESIKVLINYEHKNLNYEYFIELSYGDKVNKEYLKRINNEDEIYLLNKENDLISGKSIELFKENIFYDFLEGSDSLISRLFLLAHTRRIKIDDDSKLSSSFNELFHLFNNYASYSKYLTRSPHSSNRLILDIKKIFGEEMLIPHQRIISGVNNERLDLINETMINQAKRAFILFEQFDKNIIDLSIEKTFFDNEKICDLTLNFIKQVGNSTQKIDFFNESSGTKEFIKYFELFESMKTKETISLFDEFGSYLHDSLTINIFKSLMKINEKEDKQIILTTHSSDLLNIDIEGFNNKNKFILTNDYGKTVIKNLVGKDVKENNKIKFLSGAYGGGTTDHKIEYDI